MALIAAALQHPSPQDHHTPSVSPSFSATSVLMLPPRTRVVGGQRNGQPDGGGAAVLGDDGGLAARDEGNARLAGEACSRGGQQGG